MTWIEFVDKHASGLGGIICFILGLLFLACMAWWDKK